MIVHPHDKEKDLGIYNFGFWTGNIRREGKSSTACLKLYLSDGGCMAPSPSHDYPTFGHPVPETLLGCLANMVSMLQIDPASG